MERVTVDCGAGTVERVTLSGKEETQHQARRATVAERLAAQSDAQAARKETDADLSEMLAEWKGKQAKA